MTGFDWVDLDEGGGRRGLVEGGFGFGFFGQVGSGCRDGRDESFPPGTGLFEFGFEFFTDIRAFSPFPEFVLAGVVGLGGLESEALFFNGDAAGVEVAATECDDIGGDEAELAEIGFGFIVGRSKVVRMLIIALFPNTRARKLRVGLWGVWKTHVSYFVKVPYIGGHWTEPVAYAQPVREFLEGIAIVLRECHLDSSRYEQRIPALLDEFCSAPTRILTDWVKEAPKPAPSRLPKWHVPKDLKKRVTAAGGSWEDERYDPLLLSVTTSTTYDGREIPLQWQIEFDPFDERLEAAGRRLERRGVEPDGDGWSTVIQKAFRKRFAGLARELHDDSESSTCVLWVGSESACKRLVEFVWSMLFKI